MNNKTNFATMLDMMWNLQTSIITVKGLAEKFYGMPNMIDYIVIPNGTTSVTEFVFIRDRDGGDHLVCVKSLDMNFNDAITHFSKKVLDAHFAEFKVVST